MGSLIFATSAIVSALALAEIIIFVSRFSTLGLWLVLLVFLGEAFAVSLPEIGLGPITAYPQDIVFLILTMAGIVRLAMSNKFTYVHLLWLLLGFLILYSFARGIVSYGFEPAGVELRGFFYFFGGTLYFMGYPTSSNYLKRLALVWLYVAVALFLLALFRWVAWGIGLGVVQQWAESGHGGLRVLNAAQAFFLIQAFLVSLFLSFMPNGARIWRSFSAVLIPVIVLLQHRTVWVVALASTLLAAFQEGKVRRRVLFVLTSAIIIGAVLGLVVFGENIDKILNALSDSTAEALDTNQSTFMWRVESWKALLAQRDEFGYVDYFFGRPFGAGYTRKVWDVKGVNTTPHNYYVQTFLRLGIFGLIVLLGVYMILLRRLVRPTLRVGEFSSNRLISILLITQLLFFITYSPQYEQGIILGLAMALSMKRDEEKDQQAGDA